MRNVTNCMKTVRVINATAAGTSDVNSSSVDMLGFNAVRAVVGFGALTATQVTKIKLQGSPDDSTWSDLAGTESAALADGDGNRMIITDVFRPQMRYLRIVVDRGTANAVIDFGIFELYLPTHEPVTKDASVATQEILDYVAAGTA